MVKKSPYSDFFLFTPVFGVLHTQFCVVDISSQLIKIQTKANQ